MREPTPDEVREALAETIKAIETPAQAEAVADEVEALSGQSRLVDQAAQVAQAPVPPADLVKEAAMSAPIAETIAITAAATAPPDAAPAVVSGATEVFRPSVPAEPPLERGRDLLRLAIFRRLKPLQAVDAWLFLRINQLPHPVWLDRGADLVTVVTTGGWIWAAGVALARMDGSRRSIRALKLVIPTLFAVNLVVEGPIKAYFRRRRPFIDVVRALVVGKRPGSWSFPSGHSAASFSAAWSLTMVWPRLVAPFFGLASLVGISRIFVGAHYPGDVVSGAAFGVGIAELTRRAVKWISSK